MNTLCTLSLTLALLGPGDPPRRPVESIFPADSYAIVGFSGLDACREAAARVGWRGLADRAAERFAGGRVVDLAARALPDVDRELARLGLDRAGVRELLRRPIALGVGRLTLVDEEPMPSLALAVDAGGERRGVAERAIDALFRVAREQMRDPDDRVVEFDGVRARVIESARRRDFPLCAAIVGEFAVVTNSLPYLRAIARTWRDGQGGIADTAEFARGRAGLGDGELLFGHLQLAPFSDALTRLLPYEAEDMLHAFGVTGIGGIHLGHGVGPDGGIDELRLLASGADGGMLGALLPGGLSARAARYCPTDTLLLATQAHDGARVVESIGAFLEALPGSVRREVERDATRDIDRELRDIGMDLRGFVQLVAGLGPEITIAVSTPALRMGVPQLPAALLFVDASPESGIVTRLENALVAQGVQPSAQDFDGLRIVFVPVDAGEIRLSPAFVEHDGMLIAATDLRALKRALRRGEQGEDRLADDESFQATMAGHAGASMLWSVRLSHNLGALYDGLRPRIESLLDANPDLHVSADDLPSAEELRAALGDITMSVTAGADGVAMRFESQFAGGAMVAAAGAILDELLSMARPPARRTN